MKNLCFGPSHRTDNSHKETGYVPTQPLLLPVHLYFTTPTTYTLGKMISSKGSNHQGVPPGSQLEVKVSRCTQPRPRFFRAHETNWFGLCHLENYYEEAKRHTNRTMSCCKSGVKWYHLFLKYFKIFLKRGGTYHKTYNCIYCIIYYLSYMQC